MDILDAGIVQFVYFLVALIVTLTVHEASHALAAYYLGDPTAKLNGRLTLNPIPHLDPVGSIVFLLTQKIGWGKPVPVNPANFKNPVRDNALMALAGPFSNFILAFIVMLPLKYIGGNESLAPYLPEYIAQLLWMIFHVSIFLGIFNLFPLPPLDGSKILGIIMPKRWYAGYEKFLRNGLKYFVAIILIDVFLIRSFFGISIFASIMWYLHDIVSMILLLGG